MTWSLQPHNYTMAIRPNWYSIGYRRTGAYKGMGMLGQAPSDALNAQLWNLPMVPTQVPVTVGGATTMTSLTPSQIAIASNPLTAPAGISGTTWILIAAGALLLVLVVSGRARR